MIDPLYQGNFKYVLIPADSSRPITEQEAPKEGGLEKDALRLLAEDYFARGMKSISSSVEIVSLLLPSKDYGFVGVSMYCDQAGKQKELPINQRATSIASTLNHKDTIHGDVFFGKFHDDESLPWVRLDFGLEDLNSEAEWMVLAKQKNANRTTGAYSTSSVLQNMLKQTNAQIVTGEEDFADTFKQENEWFSWSQTNEEVEVKITLPGTLKASEFDIIIRPSKLQVRKKSATADFPVLEGNLSRLFEVGGAELYGKIDVDSSSWQLDKAKKEGKDATTIVLTLAKEIASRWADLIVK